MARSTAVSMFMAAAIGMTGIGGISSVQAAPIDIFTDAVQSPFSLHWDSNPVDETVLTPHNGTHSVRRGNGTSGNGVIIEHAGLTLNSLDGATTLEFWANSTESSVGFNQMRVTIDGETEEMATRGPGVTWVVDGVAQTGNIMLDADPGTWQHVTFDLTQTYTFWNGTADEVGTLDPNGSITAIEVRANNMSGVAAPYLDDVRLIPEPASLAMLGLGGLLMIGRRRA